MPGLGVIVSRMRAAGEPQEAIDAVRAEYERLNIPKADAAPAPLAEAQGFLNRTRAYAPRQASTEPEDFFGGFHKSLASGEALKAGINAAPGILKGAVVDLPASILGTAKTAAGLASFGNPKAQIEAGTELYEGLKQLPGHIAQTFSRAGSDPEAWGRLMGQLTVQPLVAEGAVAGIPKLRMPAAKFVEGTGKLLSKAQPTSAVGNIPVTPRMLGLRTVSRGTAAIGRGLQRTGEGMRIRAATATPTKGVPVKGAPAGELASEDLSKFAGGGQGITRPRITKTGTPPVNRNLDPAFVPPDTRPYEPPPPRPPGLPKEPTVAAPVTPSATPGQFDVQNIDLAQPVGVGEAFPSSRSQSRPFEPSEIRSTGEAPGDFEAGPQELQSIDLTEPVGPSSRTTDVPYEPNVVQPAFEGAPGEFVAPGELQPIGVGEGGPSSRGVSRPFEPSPQLGYGEVDLAQPVESIPVLEGGPSMRNQPMPFEPTPPPRPYGEVDLETPVNKVPMRGGRPARSSRSRSMPFEPNPVQPSIGAAPGEFQTPIDLTQPIGVGPETGVPSRYRTNPYRFGEYTEAEAIRNASPEATLGPPEPSPPPPPNPKPNAGGKLVKPTAEPPAPAPAAGFSPEELELLKSANPDDIAAALRKMAGEEAPAPTTTKTAAGETVDTTTGEIIEPPAPAPPTRRAGKKMNAPNLRERAEGFARREEGSKQIPDWADKVAEFLTRSRKPTNPLRPEVPEGQVTNRSMFERSGRIAAENRLANQGEARQFADEVSPAGPEFSEDMLLTPEELRNPDIPEMVSPVENQFDPRIAPGGVVSQGARAADEVLPAEFNNPDVNAQVKAKYREMGMIGDEALQSAEWAMERAIGGRGGDPMVDQMTAVDALRKVKEGGFVDFTKHELAVYDKLVEDLTSMQGASDTAISLRRHGDIGVTSQRRGLPPSEADDAGLFSPEARAEGQRFGNEEGPFYTTGDVDLTTPAGERGPAFAHDESNKLLNHPEGPVGEAGKELLRSTQPKIVETIKGSLPDTINEYHTFAQANPEYANAATPSIANRIISTLRDQAKYGLERYKGNNVPGQRAHVENIAEHLNQLANELETNPTPENIYKVRDQIAEFEKNRRSGPSFANDEPVPAAPKGKKRTWEVRNPSGEKIGTIEIKPDDVAALKNSDPDFAPHSDEDIIEVMVEARRTDILREHGIDPNEVKAKTMEVTPKLVKKAKEPTKAAPAKPEKTAKPAKAKPAVGEKLDKEVKTRKKKEAAKVEAKPEEPAAEPVKAAEPTPAPAAEGKSSFPEEIGKVVLEPIGTPKPGSPPRVKLKDKASAELIQKFRQAGYAYTTDAEGMPIMVRGDLAKVEPKAAPIPETAKAEAAPTSRPAPGSLDPDRAFAPGGDPEPIKEALLNFRDANMPDVKFKELVPTSMRGPLETGETWYKRAIRLFTHPQTRPGVAAPPKAIPSPKAQELIDFVEGFAASEPEATRSIPRQPRPVEAQPAPDIPLLRAKDVKFSDVYDKMRKQKNPPHARNKNWISPRQEEMLREMRKKGKDIK